MEDAILNGVASRLASKANRKPSVTAEARTSSRKHLPPHTARYTLWKAETPTNQWIPPSESLPPSNKLKWSSWKALNRQRSGVARSKDNLIRWNLLRDASDDV
ncbi:hypothetical protein J437_LFUL010824 [Ladona fulva]|uniref:Uncharacterized protein n=1 Tax=Ladona fulva TaxID=123851 RepID=A0A8K0KAB1_LADFU|nr:hypothetical protein J437_LFUL010824 [Ladona fulva]